MEEKINIIIPAFNAINTIDRCLYSLLNQTTEEKYRIIVLNDGSTDGTLNKLLEYKDDNRVEVVNKSNTGASDTRNRGLELANSEYVTFIDADDYVEKDYLELLLDQYKKQQCDLSIVGYCKEEKNGIVRFKGLGTKQNLSREEALHDIFISTGYEGYLWNKLFKLSIIRENKISFDNGIKIAEDLLFCCKYLSHCSRISLNPEVKYHYIVNSDSQINSNKYGSDFKKESLDVLKTYSLIKLIVEPMNYPKVVSAINASILWSSTSILRNIYLAPNKKEISPKLMDELRNNQKKYRYDFLKNDILPSRDKIIYWLNYYFPSFFAFFWRKLNLKGNGF
ncbi:glycosyltransferase [Limosilactobacillus reuteri]|uniref:Glycosyltransferase n=1 Tax=Limosilactobacillus reuteri TaxID=1598 RepID=A0A7L6BFI5_LIMRT|nr:glycosyltransferase family 2 protein [Limosilactobacillus reuteri]QLQ60887.1 glycosyltransferase [Limosilactobacillus reuteri]UFK64909.1 hypothetical protein IU404_00257 [Limosilactobacillus reuteri]UFK67656.1 hypothetical protein IVR12_00662 [Limosilactobacillus reuteri]HIS89068.1 glycosyltransferase [Candidatus Avigastranaerophilus faecigallinarum]